MIILFPICPAHGSWRSPKTHWKPEVHRIFLIKRGIRAWAMKGAVYAKLYDRLSAAITKKFWDINTRISFFYCPSPFCLLFSIQHQHPTENHSFLHNNDDIHAIPRQTACHVPNRCTNIVYMENIQFNTYLAIQYIICKIYKLIHNMQNMHNMHLSITQQSAKKRENLVPAAVAKWHRAIVLSVPV